MTTGEIILLGLVLLAMPFVLAAGLSLAAARVPDSKGSETRFAAVAGVVLVIGAGVLFFSQFLLTSPPGVRSGHPDYRTVDYVLRCFWMKSQPRALTEEMLGEYFRPGLVEWRGERFSYSVKNVRNGVVIGRIRRYDLRQFPELHAVVDFSNGFYFEVKDGVIQDFWVATAEELAGLRLRK